MNTPGEWASEIRHGHNVGGLEQTVKRIQQEAIVEGLQLARKIVDAIPVYENIQYDIVKKILDSIDYKVSDLKL